MNDNTIQVNGVSNPSQPQPGYSQDGFSFQRQSDVAKRFLERSGSLDELIKQSSLPYEDIMDWLEIWRIGAKARVPEMIIHAYHALSASAGADGEAKMFALSAIVGTQNLSNVPVKSGGGFLAKFRRKKNQEIQGMVSNVS